MDLLAFYENNYYKTMEARDRLLNRIQVTSAIIFTEFTVMSYMCRTVETQKITLATVFFSIFVLVTIASLTYSAWLLYKAYSDSAYQPIPYANEINENYNKNIAHYLGEGLSQIDAQLKANSELEEFLIGEYAFSSAKNDVKMEERSKYSRDSIKWAFLSLIGMALSATTFIANDMDASSPRKPVDIIIKDIQNLSKYKFTDQTNQTNQTGVTPSCLEIIREVHHQEMTHQKNLLLNQSQLLQHVDSQLTKTIMDQDLNRGICISNTKDICEVKKHTEKKPVPTHSAKPKLPERRVACYDHVPLNNMKK